MKKLSKISVLIILLFLLIVPSGCELLNSPGEENNSSGSYDGPITDHTWRWDDVTTTSEDPTSIYFVSKQRQDSLGAIIEFYNNFTFKLTTLNGHAYDGEWDYDGEYSEITLNSVLMNIVKLTDDEIELEAAKYSEIGNLFTYKVLLRNSSIPPIDTLSVPEEILTLGSWKMSSNKENGVTVTIPECYKDDFIIFASNGKYLFNVGSANCGPDEFNQGGTWTLADDGKTFTFDDIPMLIDITQNRLIMTQAEGGVTTVITYIPR